MDAPRSVWSRRRLRGLSLVAGLICALGVLSGAMVRADATGSHGHHPALSAAVLVDDSHAISRNDQFAVSAPGALLTETGHAVVALAETTQSTGQLPVDSVRTRGPPATV